VSNVITCHEVLLYGATDKPMSTVVYANTDASGFPDVRVNHISVTGLLQSPHSRDEHRAVNFEDGCVVPVSNADDARYVCMHVIYIVCMHDIYVCMLYM
jgi:hypothetical protein